MAAMNIQVIDWRIKPLEQIVAGIDAAIAAVRERMDSEGIDGLEGRDLAEFMLGLGFVAFQNYAIKTWTDLNIIRDGFGKPPVDKLACYRCDQFTVKQNGPTRIELINAAANYFKHHDEWSQWPDNETTRTLSRVGITQQSEFPCIEAVRIFCGDSWRLMVLHQIVREWREHVLKTQR
jgi:hypothetical protein